MISSGKCQGGPFEQKSQDICPRKSNRSLADLTDKCWEYFTLSFCKLEYFKATEKMFPVEKCSSLLDPFDKMKCCECGLWPHHRNERNKEMQADNNI